MVSTGAHLAPHTAVHLALAFSLAMLCAPSSLPSSLPLPSGQPGPTVALRVSSTDDGAAKLLEQLLLRRLGDRLLEDGYRVVPVGTEASVSVWIHLGPEYARIEAQGTELRIEEVPPGSAQLVALEIQQRTTVMIDEVRGEGDPEIRAVVVELVDAQPEAPVDVELREALQAGLLARGHALTRQGRAGDLRLCVVPGLESTQLRLVAAEQSCTEEGTGTPAMRDIPRAESAELEREYLLDGASAALREAHEPEPEPEPEPDSEPEPEGLASPSAPDDPVVLSVEPQTEPAHEAALTVSGSAGLLARVGGPDPSFALQLRGGRRRGIGGGVELLMVPSQAEGLRVFESIPTASVDWRVGFGQRGAVGLSLYGGAHVHRFVQTSGVGGRGLRVGPSVGASVQVLYLGPKGLRLGGGARGGWSGSTWTHVLAGESTWRRQPLTLGLEFTIGWDVHLRGRP